MFLPDRKRVAFAGIHEVYAESDRGLAKQEKVFEWAKSKSGEPGSLIGGSACAEASCCARDGAGRHRRTQV